MCWRIIRMFYLTKHLKKDLFLRFSKDRPSCADYILTATIGRHARLWTPESAAPRSGSRTAAAPTLPGSDEAQGTKWLYWSVTPCVRKLCLAASVPQPLDTRQRSARTRRGAKCRRRLQSLDHQCISSCAGKGFTILILFIIRILLFSSKYSFFIKGKHTLKPWTWSWWTHSREAHHIPVPCYYSHTSYRHAPPTMTNTLTCFPFSLVSFSLNVFPGTTLLCV